MVFSWALYFCQKMVERCVRLAGFSADALLMDRHRAPAMTRDSVCFGVFGDGVCAVGCNCPKVLAALEGVKATLDAAGLQCSEVDADTSRQVFTVWRLRLGLEFAVRQKQLTGDQVAKSIGHSLGAACCVVLPCLSSMLGVVLHVLSDPEADGCGPWSPKSSDGSRHRCRSSLATLPVLLSPWVSATDASGGAREGCGVTRRWCDPVDAAAAGSCAERWRFSEEEFISARRSVLVEHEQKVQKATWLGVEDIHGESRVDLHPPLLVTCRRVFSQCLMIALSSKMYHPPYYSPSPSGPSCLEASGGNYWRSCGCEGSVEILVKRLLFLLDNMALVLGAAKGRGSTPNPQPHLSQNLCHLSCFVHHPCLQMDCVRG